MLRNLLTKEECNTSQVPEMERSEYHPYSEVGT